MERNLLVAGPRDPFAEDRIVINGFSFNILRQKDEDAVPPVSQSEIDAIVCNSFFLHHRMQEFTRLKFVNLTSVGWDKFPVDTSKAMGVHAYNAGTIYSVPMAEWLLTKALELAKMSRESWANQQRHRWAKQRSLPELSEKTVAIFGLGSVASEAAPRFRAMGMKVLGVSRRGPLVDQAYDEVVGIDREEYALSRADFVVCCLPGESNTLHRFGRPQFSVMKESAYFLNVSRGSVVDQEALAEALRERVIAGAALDVFSDEPLAVDDPLWDLDTLAITPHIGFESDKNLTRLRRLVLENLHTEFHETTEM